MWGLQITLLNTGADRNDFLICLSTCSMIPLKNKIYRKSHFLIIMQSLNTTNKYKTSKEISSCNKNAPFIPPKAMEIYSYCGSK